MKTILASLVLATAVAVAQQAAPQAHLKPGDEVSLAPLAAAKWVQGEGPQSFEAGKIYIFECWATWCGPCVAAIPHVNGLYQKYHAKGLCVYGMNVWEDGEDKVVNFVKAKGDGMSYPVAYTGKGSAFETQWLKAAGVTGIPFAFVVKDGKLLFGTHPMQLNEARIEALLSGDEGAKKVAAELIAGNAARGKGTALAKNDTATMAAKLAEIEKLDEKSPSLSAMKLDLMIAQKDWPAATKQVAAVDGPSRKVILLMLGSRVCMQPADAYPLEFSQALVKAFGVMLAIPNGRPTPMEFVVRATLAWKAGDKEQALASAKKAAALAAAAALAQEKAAWPVAAFERLATAFTAGTPPTLNEFQGWLKEARAQAAPPVK